MYIKLSRHTDSVQPDLTYQRRHGLENCTLAKGFDRTLCTAIGRNAFENGTNVNEMIDVFFKTRYNRIIDEHLGNTILHAQRSAA